MYRTGMVDRKRMSNSIPRQKVFPLEDLKTLASGTLQHITAQPWKYMDVWSRRILMPGRLGAKKEPILERKTELCSPWSFTPQQSHTVRIYFISCLFAKGRKCVCHFQSHKPFMLINLTNSISISCTYFTIFPIIADIVYLRLSQKLCWSLTITTYH